MAATQFFITLSIWLVVLVAGSLALKCYVCDPSEHSNAVCSDPFVNTSHTELLFDCAEWCRRRDGYFILPRNDSKGGKTEGTLCPTTEGAFTSCRKYKQSTTMNGTNEGKPVERVVRSCGFADNGTANVKDYSYRSTETSKSEIYSCKTDGCNAAASLHVSGMVAILALALGYVVA